MIKEQELCTTCPYHEEQKSKVDKLFGGSWVLLGVLALLFGGLFTLVVDTRATAEQRHSKVVAEVTEHQRRSDKNMRDVEIALSTLNINMKRTMDKLGVEYIEPTNIHVTQVGGM